MFVCIREIITRHAGHEPVYAVVDLFVELVVHNFLIKLTICSVRYVLSSSLCDGNVDNLSLKFSYTSTNLPSLLQIHCLLSRMPFTNASAQLGSATQSIATSLMSDTLFTPSFSSISLPSDLVDMPPSHHH